MERLEQDIAAAIKRARLTHMWISIVPLGVLAYLLGVHIFPILQEQRADLLIFCLMAVLALTAFLTLLGYGVTRQEAEHVTNVVRETRQALFHILAACKDVATAGSMDAIVDRIAAGTCRALKARATVVWVPSDGGLCVAGTAGAREQGVKISLEAGRGMAGRAVTAGRPARNVTLSKADKLVDDALGIHTLHAIAVPMTGPDGSCAGVLTVHDRRDGARFSLSDLDIATAIGQIGAVAISSARSQAQQQQACSMFPALISRVIDDAYLWPGHSPNVERHALAIAEELRLGETFRESLRLACRLHDIGLDARPSQERSLSDGSPDAHPSRGADMVASMEPWGHCVAFIRTHHERMDGRGYPNGLSGYDIPLGGRILAMAEWWDEMTNPASPLRRFSEAEALEFLEKDGGSTFDPPIVHAFRDVMIRQANE